MRTKWDSTYDLQQALVSDVRPVTVLPSAGWRFSRVLVLSILPQVGFLGLSGVRRDLFAQLHNLSFLLPALGLFLAAVFGASLVVRSSVPNFESFRGEKLVVLSGLVLGAATALLSGFGFFGFGESEWKLDSSFACAIAVFALAVWPALVFVFEARRGFNTRPKTTGFAALTAAACFAVLSVNLHCPGQHFLHLLVWHYAPMFLISVAGLLAARRMLG